MVQFGPDPGIIRQWDARVARLVNQGQDREQILYMLTAANWSFPDAEQLVRKVAARERRKWALLMAFFGLLAAFGAVITFISLTSPQGGFIYVPFASAAGFVYFLIRLLRIRA